MSGAAAMEGGAENRSQRDSDIGWFLDRANQAAKGIGEAWEKAAAHVEIATAHANLGNRAAFWEAIELAHQAAAAINPAWAGAYVSCWLHEFMAEGQVRAGNVAGALNMAAGIEDAVGKARAYCTIAHAQAMAGNKAAAREAIERAEQAAAKVAGDASDAAYMSIAYAQASVGDVAAALSTVGRMVHLRFAALCQIAFAHAEAGNSSASMEAIELAKQAAAAIRDAGWKAQAYCSIAEAQAKVGNIVASKDTFELATRAAAGIADVGWKASTFLEILQAQARAGDYEGAMGTAAHINGAWNKAAIYEDIAQAQARAGEVEAVKGWIEKLTEPAEVVNACLGAVRGLLGEED